ncbi:Bromodomain-containing protein, partial [Entophlyctis helioformis]
FGEPVDTSAVTDYLTVIREPMDLGTMTSKVHKNAYRSLEDFQRDFELIVNNAKTYNAKQTVYYKEADKLGRVGRRIIERESVRIAVPEDDDDGSGGSSGDDGGKVGCFPPACSCVWRAYAWIARHLARRDGKSTRSVFHTLMISRRRCGCICIQTAHTLMVSVCLLCFQASYVLDGCVHEHDRLITGSGQMTSHGSSSRAKPRRLSRPCRHTRHPWFRT